jgi:hypothetical protein
MEFGRARSWCQGLYPELALRITARMYIGASEGASGSAALRRAAWPLGLVGLGAASHTCDTLSEIAPSNHLAHNTMLGGSGGARPVPSV